MAAVCWLLFIIGKNTQLMVKSVEKKLFVALNLLYQMLF